MLLAALATAVVALVAPISKAFAPGTTVAATKRRVARPRRGVTGAEDLLKGTLHLEGDGGRGVVGGAGRPDRPARQAGYFVFLT